MGCVLIQNGEVIAHASRHSKVHDKNYPTHNLKFDSAVFVFITWSRHIYCVDMDMFTDQKRLKFAFS